MTIVSTAHRNDLDVWAYVKDVLDQLLAGSTDYHALQADVWKQSHPEQIRTYGPVGLFVSGEQGTSVAGEVRHAALE